MSRRPPRKTKRERAREGAGDRNSQALARPGSDGARRCGLCGKVGKLTRTPCCDNWICDDEDKYVLFSFAHNSCSRNHRRYTVCGHHAAEEHDGLWQSCDECREAIQPELYAYFATNDYNFEKLAHPPPFAPTLCNRCGKVIRLAFDGYSIMGDNWFCESCGPKEMNRNQP